MNLDNKQNANGNKMIFMNNKFSFLNIKKPENIIPKKNRPSDENTQKKEEVNIKRVYAS